MATTPRRGLPFVWITWVTPLAAGKQQCQYPAWFRSHFQADELPGNFDLDRWTADHTALLDLRQREFQIDGAKVRREVWVRVKGEQALLVGKIDLVSELGAQFTVADGKSGRQSPKDLWQMWGYLYMLPKAWSNPHLRVTGEVFYAAPERDIAGNIRLGTRVEVHPEEFDKQRRAQFFEIVRMASGAQAPAKTPSVADCRNCNLVDCDLRAADYGSIDDQGPVQTEAGEF